MLNSALLGVQVQSKSIFSGLKYPFLRFKSQKVRKNQKISKILAFLNFRKRDLFKKWNISQKTDFDSVKMLQNGPKGVTFQIFGLFP